MTDHKSHPVVPPNEEYEGIMAQLGKKQAKYQQMIEARQKKSQDINDTVELSKADADKEMADGRQVLTALKLSVAKSLEDFYQTVQKKLKSKEKEADDLIKELGQEIEDLTNRSSEVMQLSHTKDVMQTVRSLKDPPTGRDWTKVKFRPPSCVGTLDKEMKKLVVQEPTLKKCLQSTMDEEREEGGPSSRTTLSGEHGRQSKAKRRVQQQRADSHGSSCDSFESDESMEQPARFKDGRPSREDRVQQQRADSHGSSCDSFESDESMEQPARFKDGRPSREESVEHDGVRRLRPSLKKYACEPTLDPNTANEYLSLSEDHRKVTRVEEEQSCPDHPDRFASWHQVLGREALTGRCYWEVEWEGWVYIGVTYRGITRRGQGDDSLLGGNNKSWRLDCDDGGYYAWYNGTETALPLPPAGSTRVGVYLDRPAGSLSFYEVYPGGGGSHLHTFWSSFTQEDLLPGVLLMSVGSSATLCRL